MSEWVVLKKYRSYSCCLHLPSHSVVVILPAMHFRKELDVKQEPACGSNRKCHEQNRRTPSAVAICTICRWFSWGLSKLSVGVKDQDDVQRSTV